MYLILFSSCTEAGCCRCKARCIPVAVCAAQPDEHRLRTPSHSCVRTDLDSVCEYPGIASIPHMTYRRTTILVIVLLLLRLKLTLFITVCACVVAGLPPSVVFSSHSLAVHAPVFTISIWSIRFLCLHSQLAFTLGGSRGCVGKRRYAYLYFLVEFKSAICHVPQTLHK